MELDPVLSNVKTFDGRFVIDESDNDVTRVGRGLSMDDDEIVVKDSGARHAIPADPKRKKVFPGVTRFHGDITFEVFDGGREISRLDAAEQGDENSRC